MRLAGARMDTTLIEIVNINLEDFSDAFLTCSTCLCAYDQLKQASFFSGTKESQTSSMFAYSVFAMFGVYGTDAPSSHLWFLTHIVVETGTLRCPMCREMVAVPENGVSAFPSSFLINQLLDLMQKQRRDIVPNCSQHLQEQLLYCESCDLVFCQLCAASSTRDCADHTVVPFSIAIKRLSEIVVYKAKLCIASLNTAAVNVDRETSQLDRNVDRVVDEINASFQEICQLVENRRRELLDSVRIMRDEKRKALRDQMDQIDAHRKK
ncbi:unnamed protein product [Gongylonema pulchrum]|uniref:B box-type domain-containing protein n=1 Tax=Gongylonema pulchrum TaxID=637853 RepID=A0A183DYI1_9BILA|nr:unnamed protein product [Gongylonema pulchrum]